MTEGNKKLTNSQLIDLFGILHRDLSLVISTIDGNPNKDYWSNSEPREKMLTVWEILKERL